MQTIEVKNSSFIREATYCEKKQRLGIVIGNTCYFYYGITRQKVARFKKAASKGRYYVNKIKGQFKMRRKRL